MDVADWITAAATLIAALWAIFTLRDTNRRARRAQASAVYVNAMPIRDIDADQSNAARRSLDFTIHNLSGAPVYDIVHHVIDVDGVTREAGYMQPCMPPEESMEGAAASVSVSWGPGGADYVAAVEFRDADGRYWRRDQCGGLRALRSPKKEVHHQIGKKASKWRALNVGRA